MLILVSFLVFDRANYMTLTASVVGATSLILNAKGNPIGQALMILFSLLYGIISYTFSYFGEMITYLGMTGPMALFALISWLRNPFGGNHAEVAVNRLKPLESHLMLVLTILVTIGFYFILDAFETANIIPSTLSVATSFIAVYLTFRRSPYFALAYAANDVVLIVLWAAAAATEPDTALLCVQAVNNETGVLQDIDALADAAHRASAAYLCDGVQSFGHVPQNLHKADFISLSAHKLGGPRGVGCLIMRQPHRLPALIHGGEQEFGLRSGTENLPGVAGLALAARLSAEALPAEAARLRQLTQQLASGLQEISSRVQFAGWGVERSPGILSCRFPGITAEEMTILLDEQGICVSPGAACGAGSGKPSHVLTAMGYSPREAAEFLRFSLGRDTTTQEVCETLRIISEIIRKRS